MNRFWSWARFATMKNLSCVVVGYNGALMKNLSCVVVGYNGALMNETNRMDY